MIAIIPARGGSKGLPGKNIKQLNGKPLIAHTILAALKAKKINRIIISTDDEEIAQVAIKFGIECPFMRPERLSTDTARAIDTYIYTLDKIEKEENCKIEEFVVLQPTSPLRTSEDIDNAISIFELNKADSVISYCIEHHPVVWHKFITEENKFEDIFEQRVDNRQVERSTYYPNGAIYVFKTDLIRKERYYTENSYAYIMDRSKSVDIDTLEDFEYTEFLLSKF